MKKALILHGTDASSKDNWFPWLQKELQMLGYEVWTPDLPDAEKPNVERYTGFLLESDWEFTPATTIIGHSSGAVEILHLLENMPIGTAIDTAVFVGAFKDDLGWDSLSELFPKVGLDFENIKSKANRFVFIHADNDPYCPLEGARYLCEKIGGEFILIEGAGHFSVSDGGNEFLEAQFVLDVLD